MVIAKSKIVEPEVQEPGTIAQDIWHKVDGTLSVKGKKLRDRVLEYLESDGVANVTYYDVKLYLAGEFPDDYRTTENGEKETLINNRDVKSVVGELVKEDKAVDS